MNNPPFFSIVIPVFNRSGILHNTLSSILKQTFQDFEIIIVDDGSTDNTKDVLQEYQKKESRINIIRQENKERGAARNKGYLNSSGKYVVFFDSDDLMHDDHLNTLHENILSNNFPDFIATKFDFVNENNKHYKSDIAGLKEGYYDYRLFLNGNALACNVCVRRDNNELYMFEENRKYSIKEDWLFLIQNLQNKRLLIIGRTTISMFDHEKRSMRTEGKEIIERTKLAYEWIIEKIKLSAPEINTLKAHVNYFCGIHAYLDNNGKSGRFYAISAIKSGGLKMKYLVLFIKSLLGRKIIQSLK